MGVQGVKEIVLEKTIFEHPAFFYIFATDLCYS